MLNVYTNQLVGSEAVVKDIKNPWSKQEFAILLDIESAKSITNWAAGQGIHANSYKKAIDRFHDELGSAGASGLIARVINDNRDELRQLICQAVR